MEEARIRIAEGALSFFKPHCMLRPIASIFPLVPLEAEHIYILSIYNVDCKREVAVNKRMLLPAIQTTWRRAELSSRPAANSHDPNKPGQLELVTLMYLRRLRPSTVTKLSLEIAQKEQKLSRCREHNLSLSCGWQR